MQRKWEIHLREETRIGADENGRRKEIRRRQEWRGE